MAEYILYSNKELRMLCKEKKIKGYSNKNKKDLIELLEKSDLNEKNEADIENDIIYALTKLTITSGVSKRSKRRALLNSISKEEAEKSADEWLGKDNSMMRTWLVNAIMDRKQHGDIGKVLAYVVESHVNKWLSEKSGRLICDVVGKPYDGITNDDKQPIIRNQIKFRKYKWHFETTRRNSKKNKDTNSTGHVAYKKDEFDMLVIFIPGPTFGITGSFIRCIPVSALVNPEKSDQLVPRITEEIRKIYDNDEKTNEVIQSLYQIPS